MRTNLFKFTSYKDVIRSEVAEHKDVRGYQTQLAKAAGCQTSFMSQVLNGKANLTLDQAIGLSFFWQFSADEQDYFFLLVELERAATPHLRTYLLKRVTETRAKRFDITNKLKVDKLESSQYESIYYASWYWIAIHVIVSIPKYKTSVAIAEKLKIPIHIVENHLEKLNEMELIQQKKGLWDVTKKNIHLSRESMFIGTHHANWRMQVCSKVFMNEPKSIHYTGVHALSIEDHEKIKDMILDFISRTRKIITPSPEEKMIFLGIDCYEI